MDERRMEIEAGLDGSHQVSLNLARLSPTASSYLEMPSSVQRIFNLEFSTLGAGGFSSGRGLSVGARLKLERIMSWWDWIRGLDNLHIVSVRVSEISWLLVCRRTSIELSKAPSPTK